MSTASERLDEYTFDYLINYAMSFVSDDVDKRPGAIIYDTLAACCYELAAVVMELRGLAYNIDVRTATGDYLDMRAVEQGLTRQEATKALRRGDFADADDNPMIIPIGSRFSSSGAENAVYFVVKSDLTDQDGQSIAGAYVLEAEAPGVSGNSYSGPILPISYINNLATATVGALLSPARDLETDDELRSRYLVEVNTSPSGGNVAFYDKAARDIIGVGDAQIYPTFAGGGTVKVSIIDAQYNTASPEFIATVQDQIDPLAHTGEGLGIAPIDHKVTITTPTAKTIDVGLSLTLKAGYSAAQIEPLVTDAIDKYLLSLRKQWGIAGDYNTYTLSIYNAAIVSAALAVPGVANVSDVTINGAATDLSLTQSGTLQELPVLGTVTYG